MMCTWAGTPGRVALSTPDRQESYGFASSRAVRDTFPSLHWEPGDGGSEGVSSVRVVLNPTTYRLFEVHVLAYLCEEEGAYGGLYPHPDPHGNGNFIGDDPCTTG